MRKLLAIAGTTGLIAVGFLASPASADPSPAGKPFPLDCGDGMVYNVVVAPGNGNWTPAFDTDSNRMFIPVEFGPSTFTIQYEDGTSETGSEPGEAKSGKRVGVQGKIMKCTYTDTFTFEDPDMGTINGMVTGEVYGFVSK